MVKFLTGLLRDARWYAFSILFAMAAVLATCFVFRPIRLISAAPESDDMVLRWLIEIFSTVLLVEFVWLGIRRIGHKESQKDDRPYRPIDVE
jgi:hypothetical protein